MMHKLKTRTADISGILAGISNQQLFLATAISILASGLTFAFLIQNEFLSSDNYPFIAGYLTSLYNIKISSRLMAVQLTTVLGALYFVCSVFVIQTIARRRPNTDYMSVLLLCLMPALFWISDLYYSRITDVRLFWPTYSLILTVSALTAFLVKKENDKEGIYIRFFLKTLALSFFAYPGVQIFCNKCVLICHSSQQIPGFTNHSIVFWLIPLAVWLGFLFLKRVDTFSKYISLPIQIGAMLLFFHLYPQPIITNGQLTILWNGNIMLYAVILPLVVLTGAELCKRFCFDHSADKKFATLPVLAVLLAIMTPATVIPAMWDRFEYGSRLAAFYASHMGDQSIFKDTLMTYGLWDYLKYLFAFLYTGTLDMTSFSMGDHLFNILSISVLFLIFRYVFSLEIAIFMLVFNRVGFGSFPLAYMALFLSRKLLSRPRLWLILWLPVTALAPFVKFPQNTVAAAATLPLVIWQSVRILRMDAKSFYKLAAAGLVLCGILAVNPYLDYALGLVRIVREVGEVNKYWSASPWRIEYAWYVDTFGEIIMGNILLLVPLLTLVYSILIHRNIQSPLKRSVIFALISVINIYTFLSLNYAYSRMDYGVSRQLQTALAVLPLLLLTYAAYRRQLSSSILAFILILLLFPNRQYYGHGFPQTPKNPLELTTENTTFSAMHDGALEHGEEYGFDHVGFGKLNGPFLAEKKPFRDALDDLLSPDETYMDLSLDAANYYLSNRRFLFEHSVYFNYPGTKAEIRALNVAKTNDIDVFYLDGAYIDAPLELSAHYLYRYVLLNCIPARIDGVSGVFFMPESKFHELCMPVPSCETQYDLLSRIFRFENLHDLPFTLGHSEGIERRLLQPVATNISTVTVSTNAPNQLVYTLQPGPALKGSKWGILLFNATLNKNIKHKAKVSWNPPFHSNCAGNQPGCSYSFNMQNGPVLLPLDSSPTWLLNTNITTVTIEIENATESNLSLSGFRLKQRKIPEEINLSDINRRCVPLQDQLRDAVVVPAEIRKHFDNITVQDDGSFSAVTEDPMIYINTAPVNQAGEAIVAVNITAPTNAQYAQLFYSNPYCEERSTRKPLRPGNNTLYFQLPATGINGDVRLDPGNVPGLYRISDIQFYITNRFSQVFSGKNMSM